MRTITVVKLKNIYNGEEVFCENLNETYETDGITFIKVFRDNNPARKFLVNKAAFKTQK